jgi:DNA repair protein RadA/Sms
MRHRSRSYGIDRFGSTSEIGLLEMSPSGLSDVKNPSMSCITLSVMEEDVAGSAVAAGRAGSRFVLCGRKYFQF